MMERLKALDEKFLLLINESEKRNEQRFEAQQQAVSAALASAEKAVTKAEIAAEKRFESVNEFRKTLSDQTSSFITRNEFNMQNNALTDKIGVLENKVILIDKTVGEVRERGAGKHDFWGYLTVGGALLISLVTVGVLLSK